VSAPGLHWAASMMAATASGDLPLRPRHSSNSSMVSAGSCRLIVLHMTDAGQGLELRPRPCTPRLYCAVIDHQLMFQPPARTKIARSCWPAVR
jgi:hypothetical protein